MNLSYRQNIAKLSLSILTKFESNPRKRYTKLQTGTGSESEDFIITCLKPDEKKSTLESTLLMELYVTLVETFGISNEVPNAMFGIYFNAKCEVFLQHYISCKV